MFHFNFPADTRQALKLLERIQDHLQKSEAAQLNPTVGDDLTTLISVLDSPVFNSILNIQVHIFVFMVTCPTYYFLIKFF